MQSNIEFYLARAEQLKALLRNPAGTPGKASSGLRASLFGRGGSAARSDSGSGAASPSATGRGRGSASDGAGGVRGAGGVKRPYTPASTPTSSGPVAVGGGDGGAGASKELTAMEAEILEEVLSPATGVTWDSIAGLAFAKQQLVRQRVGVDTCVQTCVSVVSLPAVAVRPA